MKKKLQSMTLILALCFAFSSTGFAQEILLQQTGGAAVEAPAERDEHGEWIYWDSGENNGNSIGTDAAAEFSIAHRWMPEDLDDYDGMDIVTIRFFPRYQDATYTVKIWSGADGNEVYSQEVDEFTNEDWNEIELEDAYEIDASEDLWYGVHIDTQGGFPAGCDDGPQVAGKGNMMIWDGDWVELTDLNDELIYNWNLGAYVLNGDNGDEEEMHTVTLNVDMTDAVAQDDVVFDPDIHDVWVTGTFAEWATPGENVDFQLQPADVAKDEHEEMLYPGNWDEDTEGVLGHWAEDGGPIFGTNTYNDAGYGQIFEIDEEYHIDAAKFWIGSVAGEAGDVVFTIWDYSDGSVGDVLGDKTIPLADISASDNLEDAFTVQFDEPVHVVGDFFIGADISDLNAYDPDVYELANIHSDFDTGGGAGLALVLEGTNWVPVLNYDVDVDVAIFPIVADENDEPGEEDIYTITFEAAEGDHEYKYFLVEDEPTWDIGEWAGDPNRALTVEADMVVDEEWGDLVVSVPEIDEEQLLSVYPNPVSSQLYVSSNSEITDIKVYDITGRMLIQQTEDVIDVSGLRTGVYIIQVNTPEGTEARRFNVAR